MITPLDVALILLALVLILRGAWVGLIRQLASLAGLLLGYIAAGHYYSSLSHFVLPIIQTPQLAFLVTFLVLLIVVYLATLLLGLGLKTVVQISLLSWFDRFTGALFGLGKAFLLVVFLFIATIGVMDSTPPFLQESIFFPVVEKSAHTLLPYIQDQDLRKKFLPQKAAIENIFSDPPLKHPSR